MITASEAEGAWQPTQSVALGPGCSCEHGYVSDVAGGEYGFALAEGAVEPSRSREHGKVREDKGAQNHVMFPSLVCLHFYLFVYMQGPKSGTPHIQPRYVGWEEVRLLPLIFIFQTSVRLCRRLFLSVTFVFYSR